MSREKIRVGVVGISRGASFLKDAAANNAAGLAVVSLCDTWEQRLVELGRQHGITTYTDYDAFLEHDMDAVILANYFHQHAPFAIRALEAGKHVMSETAANTTLAEGVALCRTVERTGGTYMLAENYPYTAFSQEMRRLYQAGQIGQVTYADGEYNHPLSPDDHARLTPGLKHWRAWLPPTYYCTHALAPLIYITEARPVKVNGLSIACPQVNASSVMVGDPGTVILCRMDNGAVFRVFGLKLPGHSNWYRVHGTRGAMEITRGPGYFGPGQIRIWHEAWDLQPGEKTERAYTPTWPEHADLAGRAGHGGGDFWTNLHFAQAIRTGQPPFLDVYRSVTMSSVGILAWKSALEEGRPFEVPNFNNEQERCRHQDDHWSPWPEHAGPGQPPPSILGVRAPSPQAIERACQVWERMGYHGP